MSQIDRAWPYPRVLAHRCGGVLAPENTLIGLNLSAALGCGGVEFDVMLNAEQHPFVVHDDLLDRTTDGRGRVDLADDTTLLRCDAGSWFGASFAGEPVPRFAQVATRCQGLGLAANVEIKPAPGHDADTGRIVASEAARLWESASIPPLLSSFSEVALESAGTAAPSLPRGLLLERLPADWLQRCGRLAVASLHLDESQVHSELVAAVRTAGLWMAVYTVNSPERAQALLAMGVDCVITDRPDLVRAPPP